MSEAPNDPSVRTTWPTHLRPHLRNAGVLGAVAVVFLVLGHQLVQRHPDFDGWRVAAYVCALLVLASGIAATRSAAGEIGRAVGRHTGAAASTPLRLIVLVVGYLITVIGTLDTLQVDLSQFLVGGAVTGVVIGIAAQQSLGNFFAGLVLLLARPYVEGDHVTVFSGSINGPHAGTIEDVGLMYTSLRTTTGSMKIPNSVLLASAVEPTTYPDANPDVSSGVSPDGLPPTP